MRIERTKNASRNLVWGVLSKVVGLLVPFICRGAIIRIFGINYLGLNSLFTSVLTALNLAELGFGSSIVFFMYRAIAEDDTNKICALMQFYKKTYRIIGIIVLAIGLSLTPFLNHIIKSDVPDDINIYAVYLITLSGTVVTYLLFAYKNSILIAFQRNDISSKISTIVLLAERLVQLFFILALHNYYLYLGTTVVMNALNNIVTAKYADKLYPQYKAYGVISKEEKYQIGEKIKGLFLYKVGGIVLSSADTIVISSFIGLVAAGIYGNYYYVISTLFSFLAIYYASIRAGLGNSIAVESVEKNYSDFRLLQFIQNWVTSWCTVCLLCLFQDFISIYAGKDNMLPNGLVICICAYFYLWKIQDVVSVYKEASGLWNTDKFRPLIGGVVNLALNCFLVQFIGLYGIVLSTVFVITFIDVPWSSKVLFTEYFHVGQIEYFKLLGIGILQLLAMIVPTYLVCSIINFNSSWINLLIKGVICVVIPNGIYTFMNYRQPEFKKSLTKIKAIIHKGA